MKSLIAALKMRGDNPCGYIYLSIQDACQPKAEYALPARETLLFYGIVLKGKPEILTQLSMTWFKRVNRWTLAVRV